MEEMGNEREGRGVERQGGVGGDEEGSGRVAEVRGIHMERTGSVRERREM